MNKIVFVFDTETTGLPNKKLDLSHQPHIIQFAGELISIDDNGEYNLLNSVNYIIKPPINIPYESSKVHNLYDIDVIGCEPFSFYADDIFNILNSADIIVGHNIQFDIDMLNNELRREKKKGRLIDFAPRAIICTMVQGTNWCKLKKKDDKGKGYKRPKLQELCRKALGTTFEGAHNAVVDVENTTKAFAVMVAEGVVSLDVVENNTLF